MTEFLQYVYVYLWGILAVLMFFTGRRQGAYAYALSAFFVYMTVWYALGTYGDLPVFEGMLGHIFRGVLIVFLGLFIIIYMRSRKSGKPIFRHEDYPQDKNDE